MDQSIKKVWLQLEKRTETVKLKKFAYFLKQLTSK